MEDSKLFKENVLSLINLSCKIINYVKETGYETTANAGIFQMGSVIVSISNNDDLIDGFINRSYIHWKIIKEKNIDFLINNSSLLFSDIDQDTLHPLTELFEKKIIKDEYIDELWDIIHDMITNCLNYIHIRRKKDPNTGKYTVTYIKEINLRLMKEMWNE